MLSKNTPSSCTAEHLGDFTFMLQLSPVNLEAGSQADIGRSCISSAFAIFPRIPIHQPAKSWTCAMEKVWRKHIHRPFPYFNILLSGKWFGSGIWLPPASLPRARRNLKATGPGWRVEFLWVGIRHWSKQCRTCWSFQVENIRNLQHLQRWL